MMFSRRSCLSAFAAGIGGALLPACAAPERRTEVAGRGLIVVQNGKRLLETVGGFACGLSPEETGAKRAFTAETPFRAASMSKVATLLIAKSMARAGGLNLDTDISEALDFAVKSPASDRPITLRHLLAHRSGITDPEVYWMRAGGNIRDLLTPDIYHAYGTGEYFNYANLNYGLAASVMEAVSGQRFDRLAAQYLTGPLGIDAGFNWAGVSTAKRLSGAALYRTPAGGRPQIQVDGPDMLRGDLSPFYGGDDYDFDRYRPGEDGTLFSPQGGFRASLNDLLVLAQSLADYPEFLKFERIVDGKTGNTEGGHFVSFGAGLYVYPPDLSPIPGQLMIGHHGEAYGLYGGLWHLPQIGAQIVHVVTGTPDPPRPYHAGPPAMAPESRDFLNDAIKALNL